MVLLDDKPQQSAKEYLESSLLMPSLEVGLEEMLKTCSSADSKRDPINFLASWLMRNNPNFNETFKQQLGDMRAAEAAADAEKAAAASAAATAAEVASAATPAAASEASSVVNLNYPGGTMALSL